MQGAGEGLKRLRTMAGLSLRQMAEAAGYGENHNGYRHYEVSRRKWLPLDKAEQFARILEQHGIPREDVLALAGVKPGLAESERPSTRSSLTLLPVALPSEDSLAAMFEQLLTDLPETLGRHELARALARRLPAMLLPYATRDAGLPTGSGTRRKPAPPA